MDLKVHLADDRASGIALEEIMTVITDQCKKGMLLHLLILLVRSKGMLFLVTEKTDSKRFFQIELSEHGTVVNKLLTTTSVQLQECQKNHKLFINMTLLIIDIER